MTVYRVTAGYVTATTAVPGGGRASIDIPRGAQLPGDVPAEEVERLLRLGYIEPAMPPVRVEPGQPSADVATPVPTGEVVAVEQVPTGSVADVLAWVGDDLARAAAALNAEQARGDRTRSTLLTGLDALLAEDGV